MTIILVLLGYVIIASIITAIILIRGNWEAGWALFNGVFWPITIPVYILLYIICRIAYLIADLVKSMF